MERKIDLSEISDGKLYTAEDLVKAGCGDCAGCSSCCRETGDTIILDPYDIWELGCGLKTTFAALLEEGRRVYEVLDLGFGKCRMCVCGPAEAGELLKHHKMIRVASKYPNIAKEYFYNKKNACRNVREYFDWRYFFASIGIIGNCS